MSRKGHRCAVGEHKLGKDPVTVQDRRHIEFIRKIVKDFRPEYELCGICFRSIKKAFDIKRRRHFEKLKAHTVSTTAGTDESFDSIDRLVNKTPRNKQLKDITKGGTYLPRAVDNNSETSFNSESTASVTTIVPKVNLFGTDIPSDSSSGREKRRRSTSSVSTDDDENTPGINVLRGARLPHIQPVPKRRQIVHVNADVMDLYIRDITGG